ncbi:hypothetical protein V6N11_076431 [Hibiscus sabdariffa]|uniref:Uncharacterized protein n=1 Tax=Hibiscus sabdariffa TaxID=183260 RepID=A0ABR2Q6K0_9ROSI
MENYENSTSMKWIPLNETDGLPPVISAHNYCALGSPLRLVAHQSRQPATDSRTPRLQPQPTDRKHQAGKHPESHA